MSTLVLGTVALDTVKTPFGIRKNMLGGSAVHFAMSCRLFDRVNLVAIIGEDFPQRYIDFLKAKGIVLTSLIRARGRSFAWHGEYSGDLSQAQTLSTELGVLARFMPTLSPREGKIRNIFLANVDPEIQSYLLRHMHTPRLIGLDSMNYWIKHKRKSLLKVLKQADIYVANDAEARSLSGETNLIQAARCLVSLGPKMVLIKKGEHGVLFYGQGIIFLLPAYPTDKVIDPTGAGDTFAGGFMGVLARVKKITPSILKKAIAYGTIAASFNVEGFGTEKSSRLTFQDLTRRLKRFRKCILI
jgi:sugar/nucleoside kinase (ribokinase family)